MTNIVQNLRGSRRLRVAAPLLPAAVLPILLTGVTVPAATGIGAAFESVERVEERARRVDVAARRIAEFGDLAQIDELRRAIEVLRNIVPEADEELALFNRVRFVADQLGLELKRCDIGATQDLGVPVDGESVFARELSVAGVGTLTGLVDLLAQLRAQGCPVAVLDVSLSRGAAAERDFQFALRLAVLHRAPELAPQLANGSPSASANDAQDPGNSNR